MYPFSEASIIYDGESAVQAVVPWRRMGASAEVAVGSDLSLIRVPATSDPFTSAHWAAFYSTGLNAYESPVLDNEIFTVEMPPYVPSPPREGFTWVPLGALNAAGQGDIAHMVWQKAAFNTWRGWASYFAWIGLASSIVMAALSSYGGARFDSIFLVVPGIGLGAGALAAMSTDPAPGAARIAAIGALVIAVLTGGWSIARFFLNY